MDTENYEAETPRVDAWTDPWADPVNIIQKHIGHITRRANAYNDRVTAGGDRDMNASLVESTRALESLSVVIELQGLLNEVRAAQESVNQDRMRQAAQSANRAYEQGVNEGITRGMDRAERAQERDRQDAGTRLAHGNPAEDRDEQRVIIPQGYVAAWFHVFVDAEGDSFSREVYGTLDAAVREGDTRAVIVAGPDKHLIALERVRFAPTLHTLIAERDLNELEGLKVRHADQSGVRVVDAMDQDGNLDLMVHTLPEKDAGEDCQAGTYLRFTAASQDGGSRAVVDVSKEQFRSIVQAAETLYARHLIAQAGGDES
jgi:hypothetical protein